MKALCQTRKISSPARRTFLKPPEGRKFLKLRLRPPEHVLKRVAFFPPWVFGIPNHAAIAEGLVRERATP